MNISENELEQRVASRLMDVLIRAALIFLLALLCYRIFAPFLSLMVWASILAVTLYPVHRPWHRSWGASRDVRQPCW